MKATTNTRNAHSSNGSKRPNIMQTEKVRTVGGCVSYAPTDTLLSVPQAAKRLGIATKTGWNWIYLRRLPVVRLSRGCVRISEAALEEMIRSKTVPAIE